jgi:DNA-directed RNA polymerase specialized sigma24 family protein
VRIENDQVFSTQLQALEPCLRKRALRFARGDRDEAEDLFQAISVRLWENLASYRGDGPFSAWHFAWRIEYV